jgi:hypothetical protein
VVLVGRCLLRTSGSAQQCWGRGPWLETRNEYRGMCEGCKRLCTAGESASWGGGVEAEFSDGGEGGLLGRVLRGTEARVSGAWGLWRLGVPHEGNRVPID